MHGIHCQLCQLLLFDIILQILAFHSDLHIIEHLSLGALLRADQVPFLHSNNCMQYMYTHTNVGHLDVWCYACPVSGCSCVCHVNLGVCVAFVLLIHPSLAGWTWLSSISNSVVKPGIFIITFEYSAAAEAFLAGGTVKNTMDDNENMLRIIMQTVCVHLHKGHKS